MEGHSNQGVVDPPGFPVAIVAVGEVHAVLSSAAYRNPEAPTGRALLGIVADLLAITLAANGQSMFGFSAGFVARTGNVALQVSGFPQPDVIAPDLAQMAHQMIALWR